MPLDRVCLRRLVPLPFLRHQVNQHRPRDLAYPLESVHHLVDVVAVQWAEIAESEFLEEHAGHEQVLHAFLEPPGS